MKKTERALRIIAGCEPAWVHWKVFFPLHEIPARDKNLDSVQVHQDHLSARVRAEACHWLGKRLNLVTESWEREQPKLEDPFHDDVDEAEHAGPAPEILS